MNFFLTCFLDLLMISDGLYQTLEKGFRQISKHREDREVSLNYAPLLDENRVKHSISRV